jgi:hypothetical protein
MGYPKRIMLLTPQSKKAWHPGKKAVAYQKSLLECI